MIDQSREYAGGETALTEVVNAVPSGVGVLSPCVQIGVESEPSSVRTRKPARTAAALTISHLLDWLEPLVVGTLLGHVGRSQMIVVGRLYVRLYALVFGITW